MSQHESWHWTYERAKASADGRDVRLWGGAQIINQYLAAGLLDELEQHIAPLLLGGGARLFDDLGGAEIKLEQVRAIEAPGVTHVKYRVVRQRTRHSDEERHM